MYHSKHITVIVPAYNEALSIYGVVNDLYKVRNAKGLQLVDQLIVCDNASSDKTSELASKAGATLAYESQAGYGSACLKALSVMKPTDIIVFVDGDASVKVSELPSLLDEILKGSDLVIGVRKKSLQEKGALHWQQRVGTQLACHFLSFLYKTAVHDLGPFRAIRSTSLNKLNMQDKRFGWTAEMQAKALFYELNIKEIPVSVKARIGKSKISGTLKGTVLAAFDIFSTIWMLWKEQRKNVSIRKDI